MNNKKKYLGMLLAVLMLATAVPGFFAPVTAQTATVKVYDSNDEVFFIGETLYIEFTVPVDIQGVYFVSESTSQVWGLNYEVVEHTYDPSTGHHYLMKVELNPWTGNLVILDDLRVVVLLQNDDSIYSPVIYINKLTLTEVVSVATETPVDGIVTNGQWQSGNGYLLIGDAVNMTFVIESNAPMNYILENARLYFGGYELVIYNESTTIKAKVVEYPITDYVTELNVTSADNQNIFVSDVITQGFQLNAGVVLVDQYPYDDSTPDYDERVIVATAGSTFDVDAYVYWAKGTENGWELHYEFYLPYNITIKLPEGMERTDVAEGEDNTTFNIEDVTAGWPITITGTVQIPEDYTPGVADLTVIEHKTGNSWIWPLVYVLEADKRGYVEVDKGEYYIAVDTVEITYAITDVGASNEYYQLVLMDEDGKVLYNITDPQLVGIDTYGTSQTYSWPLGFGINEWPLNVPPGTYYIGLILYNGTAEGPDDVNFTTKVGPINFIWDMTIVEFGSVYNKYYDFEGPIYPGDDIFLNFTSTHDGGTGYWLVIFNNTNFSSIYNGEDGWPPENMVWSGWIYYIPNYNESTHIGYAAVNLSTIQDVGFDITKLEPGTYYLVVYDELSWFLGRENITIFPVKEFTVVPHEVTPSEPSASIPIGTSYKIQVTTTSSGPLDIDTGDSGITVVSVDPDKTFNSSTHTAVWNVTFKTDSNTELGEWPIEITVTDGEPATFTLTVTDEMNVLYVPTKVVLGNSMFIMLNTTANLTESDYKATVWALGVSKTPAPNLQVFLGTYNKSRIVNMTFTVDESIRSTDPVNYPTHYMNITDGKKWVVKEFEIVKDPALNLGEDRTVIVDTEVTFEGTTLLAPGTTLTVEIVEVNPENVSEIIGEPITDSTTVELDMSGDENTFKFTYTFETPGLYNVTVKWGDYSDTIQVNVTTTDLTLNTDRDEYYPDGKIKVTGQFDNVTAADAITLKFEWIGGSSEATNIDLVNGTYEHYFDMSVLSGYSGDLVITAIYDSNGDGTPEATATKTVTIVSEPNLATPAPENLTTVIVGGEELYGVKLGEGLFNVTAQSNLGVDATVTLKVLNATEDLVCSKPVHVLEGGIIKALVNMTNATKYPVGKYFIVLEYGAISKNFTVYVWEQGANITLKNATFEVPEETVVPFTVTVNVTLENIGDLDGDYTVEVLLDGEVANSTTVTVMAGEEKSVVLKVEITEPGEHVIKVDGFNTTVTALAPANVSVVGLTVEPTEEVVPFTATINVTLENTGDVDAENYTVKVYVGQEELTKSVTVPAHNTTTVTFTYEFTVPGTYIIKAGEFNKTVTALAPAEFVLSNLTVEPTEGVAPLNITVSAVVENTGNVAGNYTAVLFVDGEAVANKTVEVAGKSSEVVEFNYTIESVGVHTVKIGDLEAKVVKVLEPADIRLIAGTFEVTPTEGVAPFNITAKVYAYNTGNVAGNYTAVLYVDGVAVANKTVEVPAGESVLLEMTYEFTEDMVGVHNVTIDDLTPVQVTALAPANVSVKNVTFDVPEETVVPFTVAVNVTLINTGDVAGNYTVEVYLDDAVANSTTVTVEAGEEKSVVLNVEITEVGDHVIVVDDFEVAVTALAPPGTLASYEQKVKAAEHVYVVYGSGALSSDSFAISAYISGTVPADKFLMRLDTQIDMSKLTEKDVVVAVGGPAVNEITAAFEPVAPVHMVIGENITIVTPKGNLTWSAPEVWYNVTEGYFIIQLFEDNETGALVVTIYGTDADSTLAGAYYFANTIYPNLEDYAEVSWIVGKWTDDDAGEPVIILDPADTSGFNPADTIAIVYQG